MNEKILCFGIHSQGTSHKKNDIPCQDYHKIIKLDNGWAIAAVADGVGSASKAEKGSSTAVESALLFCLDNFPFDGAVSSMKAMLNMAFNHAMREIIKLSRAEKCPIEDYDTTLTIVIYNGVNIVYGHVGDGGIIGLTSTGEYQLISSTQKGDDGISMVPLRYGAKFWDFEAANEEYASILLATDGLLDNLFMPHLLVLQDQKLYIPELRKLMDRKYNLLSENNVSEFETKVETVMNDPEQFLNITTDDKTVVVMISNLITADEQDESYYAEPDWEKLSRIRREKLYAKSDKKVETEPETSDNVITGEEEHNPDVTKIENNSSELLKSDIKSYLSTDTNTIITEEELSIKPMHEISSGEAIIQHTIKQTDAAKKKKKHLSMRDLFTL